MNVSSEQYLAIARTDRTSCSRNFLHSLNIGKSVSTEPLLLDVTMLWVHFCHLHQTWNFDVFQTSTIFLTELQIYGKPRSYTLQFLSVGVHNNRHHRILAVLTLKWDFCILLHSYYICQRTIYRVLKVFHTLPPQQWVYLGVHLRKHCLSHSLCHSTSKTGNFSKIYTLMPPKNKT